MQMQIRRVMCRRLLWRAGACVFACERVCVHACLCDPLIQTNEHISFTHTLSTHSLTHTHWLADTVPLMACATQVCVRVSVCVSVCVSLSYYH